jgi:hypothetical protein
LQSGKWSRIGVTRTTLIKTSAKLRRLKLPEASTELGLSRLSKTTTESPAILRLLGHTKSATKTSSESTVRLGTECAKAATIGRELLTESTTKHGRWTKASAEAASTAAISASATTYAHV